MRKAPLVLLASLFGMFVTLNARMGLGWKVLCLIIVALAFLVVLLAYLVPRLDGPTFRYTGTAQKSQLAAQLLVLVSILLTLGCFSILYFVS